MPKNRCPWCGEACIPQSYRFPKMGRRYYYRPGRGCPACDREIVLSVSTRKGTIVWNTIQAVLYILVVLILGILPLFGNKAVLNESVLLKFTVFLSIAIFSLVVVVYAAFIIRNLSCHWMRCHAPQDSAAHRREELPTLDIFRDNAAYTVRVEQPLPLRTERIYTVQLPVRRDRFVCKEVPANSDITVYFEPIEGHKTLYRAAFLRPNELRLNMLAKDMRFTVTVGHREVPATFVGVAPTSQ